MGSLKYLNMAGLRRPEEFHLTRFYNMKLEIYQHKFLNYTWEVVKCLSAL